MAVAKWVIILGSPRSGTTWTQLLLSQHPEVATCPETHLVDGYLAPLYERARWEEQKNVTTGLTSVLEPEELERLFAGFADAVRRQVASRGGEGSRIFLEKTPQNALHPDLLLRHFSDARFLHVIRDPRDVVVSLLAVSRSWGADWAPPGPVEATRLWVRHVRGARRLRHAPGYRELRFEDLKEDPAAELGGLHEWLGLPTDSEMRREAVEACRLDRLRKEPERFAALPEKIHDNAGQFFRKAGTSRPGLSRSARAVVERVAGDEMRELGYEASGGRVAGASARVLASRLLRRAGDAVAYRLHWLASRL